jgi:hypothetical protein
MGPALGHVYRELVGRYRLEAVAAHVEVPSGEVPAMGSPDATGTQSAEWHATPRTIVDERRIDVLPGPFGTVVGKPDRPPPGIRSWTREDLGSLSLNHRLLLLQSSTATSRRQR